MSEVSIRDLRNHGGDVVDRAMHGEEITITRDGTPVAELHPLRAQRLSGEVLLARWRRLPNIDVARFRADVDAVIDQTL
ncbi:MAG: type II toxin-antitoxin system prevent-host-death family antitoxin [Candidatus Dormibacteraeota bacterium]|nr:type II toxin-antitoxin system prevent-host-death family antitoxin [Candidatus Dormibacteraeota bacterium]